MSDIEKGDINTDVDSTKQSDWKNQCLKRPWFLWYYPCCGDSCYTISKYIVCPFQCLCCPVGFCCVLISEIIFDIMEDLNCGKKYREKLVPFCNTIWTPYFMNETDASSGPHG